MCASPIHAFVQNPTRPHNVTGPMATHMQTDRQMFRPPPLSVPPVTFLHTPSSHPYTPNTPVAPSMNDAVSASLYGAWLALAIHTDTFDFSLEVESAPNIQDSNYLPTPFSPCVNNSTPHLGASKSQPDLLNPTSQYSGTFDISFSAFPQWEMDPPEAQLHSALPFSRAHSLPDLDHLQLDAFNPDNAGGCPQTHRSMSEPQIPLSANDVLPSPPLTPHENIPHRMHGTNVTRLFTTSSPPNVPSHAQAQCHVPATVSPRFEQTHPKQPMAQPPLFSDRAPMQRKNSQPTRSAVSSEREDRVGTTRTNKRVSSRIRRRRTELRRKHACPWENCGKRYEAWRSLQHHVHTAHGVRVSRPDFDLLFSDLCAEPDADKRDRMIQRLPCERFATQMPILPAPSSPTSD